MAEMSISMYGYKKYVPAETRERLKQEAMAKRKAEKAGYPDPTGE